MASFSDLPMLCLDLTLRFLIDEGDTRHDRAAAAKVAAMLALTSKDCAMLSRCLYDAVVDPGCQAVEDAELERDARLRSAAAAELQALRLLPPLEPAPPAEDIPRTSAKQLRAAIAAISPPLPASGTKLQLHERLVSAVAHREERAAALGAFLAQPALRQGPCPVRPHARAVVVALRSGDMVKRALVWARHRVSAAELASVPRKARRNYMLADVLAVVERKARARDVAPSTTTADPIASWEKARRARIRDVRRAAATARLVEQRAKAAEAEVARRLLPDVSLAEVMRDTPAELGRSMTLWLDGKKGRLPEMVDAAVACYGRARVLVVALERLGVPKPAGADAWHAIWMRYVAGAAEESVATVATGIAEARFLHTHTPYCAPFVGRAAAMSAFAASAHRRRLAPGYQVPPGLQAIQRFVTMRPLRILTAQPASQRWGTAMMETLVETTLLERGDGVVTTEIVNRAAKLDDAISRIDRWTHEVARVRRCDVSVADRAVATAIQNEPSALHASREQVFSLVEAAIGVYRCPLCPTQHVARYTEAAMDAHIREVHEEEVP
jgi:hypothetical protein